MPTPPVVTLKQVPTIQAMLYDGSNGADLLAQFDSAGAYGLTLVSETGGVLTYSWSDPPFAPVTETLNTGDYVGAEGPLPQYQVPHKVTGTWAITLNLA